MRILLVELIKFAMRKIYTFLPGTVVLFLLFFNSAYAQQPVSITGTVTDAVTGETLIGVSVIVKGTNTGTQTDLNGEFSIQAPSNSTIVFTYIGFVTQEIALSDQTNLQVKLESDAQQLEQVVVVGYGTQRRIDVTGSVASVRGEDISRQASVNPISALQGKAAGVNITNTGAPGSAPTITIRGTGTIYGNTGVLYVVDGVWYNDVNFLNPSDIESVSILKDASSQSIYGIRAANGVVLITTKKGRSGDPTINYNGSVG
jgi:TonB-dependent SusC/RagA subfamily outer membrane receptor